MFNYIFSILYIFIMFCSCCSVPRSVRKFVFEIVQRLMTFLFMQNEGGFNVLLSLCRERWSTGWPVRCMQPVGKDPPPQWVKGWWKETVSPSPGSFAPPNSGQSQSAVMFLTMSGFKNIWQIAATTIYTLKGVGIILLFCICVKMNLLVQLLLWGVCSLSSTTPWAII